MQKVRLNNNEAEGLDKLGIEGEEVMDKKLNLKVVAMLGDAQLEKHNLELMDEGQKAKMSEKAAKLVGSNVVLKKKLRDRFGSEMHIESLEMMAAKEKYEKMKVQSTAGYLQGSVGEAIFDINKMLGHKA